jgi:hypothetical protein
MNRLSLLLLAPPFNSRGGRQRFDHKTNVTSWGLQQVSLELEPEPVVLLALVEQALQQVSPPLFPLVSLVLSLCTQSQLRQY